MKQKNKITIFKKKPKGFIVLLLLFFLNPLIAFFVSIKNHRIKNSEWIVVLFSSFLGFTFVSSTGQDAWSVALSFHRFELSFQEVMNEAFINLIYYGVIDDYIREIIFSIIGLFTDSHLFVWGTFGLLFGIIYSKNIWFHFHQFPNQKININALIFLIGFMIVIDPVNAINQRIWIAASLFFLGTVNFFFYKKLKYIILAISSVFIHIALVVPIVGLLAFLLIGRREKVYFIFFAFSLSTTFYDLSFLISYIDILGFVVEEKFISYSREEMGERFVQRFEQGAWFMAWRVDFLLWSILAWFIYSYFKYYNKIPETFKFLFCYFLILFSIVNLLSDFPMVYRYWPFPILFGVSYLYLINQHFNFDKFHFMNIIILPSLLLYCIVQLRISFDSVSSNIFFTNPIFELILENNKNLWEVIPI